MILLCEQGQLSFFFSLLLFLLIYVFIRALFDAKGTFAYGKGTKVRQQ